MLESSINTIIQASFSAKNLRAGGVMEMHPQEEYGKYYPEQNPASVPQQPHLDATSDNNNVSQEATILPRKSVQFTLQGESISRHEVLKGFLDEKYKNDLHNAEYWRNYTRIVSSVGVAIIFLGAAGAITVSFFAGPLVAGVVAGLSTLSGLLTNIFLHLVSDPAGKANQQLEDTCKMIQEEIEHVENMVLLMKLNEDEQREYIKYKLYKRNDISVSIKSGEMSEKGRKSSKKPSN